MQGNFLNREASDFRYRSKATEQYCTVSLALQLQHSYQVPTPNGGGSDARLCGSIPRRQHPFHTAAAPLTYFMT